MALPNVITKRREIDSSFRWIITFFRNKFYVYLFTPCSTVLLEKLTVPQLFKKFSLFYGTRRFIIPNSQVPATCPILSQLYPSIPPHSTAWKPIIISSHLSLGLPSCSLSLRFSTKILYMPLLSPIRTTCSTHLILLDFITRTILGKEYG